MTRDPLDSVQVIEVIETVHVRGDGVDGNPIRPVFTYWDKEGKKLAERDVWEEQQRKEVGGDD
jgi:hypothetical protein